MGTSSGFPFFLVPDVSKMLNKKLNAWAESLGSTDSTHVLGENSSGRFSKHDTENLAIISNVDQMDYSFNELFKCDPTKIMVLCASWMLV